MTLSDATKIPCDQRVERAKRPGSLNADSPSLAIDVVAFLLAVAGTAVCGRLWLVARHRLIVVHAEPWQETSYGWWLGLSIFATLGVPFALSAVGLLLARVAPSRRTRGVGHVLSICGAASLGITALWYLTAVVSEWITTGQWTFGLLALMTMLAWTVLYNHWKIIRSSSWQIIVLVILVAPAIPFVQWAFPSMEAAAAARAKYEFGEGEARVVRPAGSLVTLSIASAPHFGPLDAPLVVVSYFDYTSGPSRETQRALLALHRRFGQVVVLPVLYPLDPGCNPKVTKDMVASDPDSCTYARLSNAVWLANPEAWPEFHEQLITATHRDQMPSADEARALASKLVGPDALAQALDSPRLEQLLAEAIAAKPQRLSSGLPSESEAGGIIDVRPCTMWKVPGERGAVMVTIGEMNEEGLLREFEEYTGAVPRADPGGAKGDAHAALSLMELLHQKTDQGDQR